ncbi:MAG: hypothetical protein RL329_579 [Bacteroidota bacterium]
MGCTDFTDFHRLVRIFLIKTKNPYQFVKIRAIRTSYPITTHNNSSIQIIDL